MWYGFGRIEGFPTIYGENKTPVTVDVLEVGLILAFVFIAFCYYIIIPGFQGKRAYVVAVRVTVILILGGIIIIGNFGQEWEVGHLTTATPYRIGTGHEIHADIGVKIGLRSVNVTLKSTPPANTPLEHEMIDYNERFEWTWDQGRFGFGPYAGELQRSFRAAQYKGLPLPILWIVDYFVFDGEGLRFGRFYRTAGWYSHIVMWTAFPCWLLSIVLFRSVIVYGTYMLGLAGVLQLVACIIWGVVRNPQALVIPFEDGSIHLKFGSSFYVTLVGGILCVSLSIIIFVLNLLYPDEVADFFGIDPLAGYEELHLTQEELDQVRQKSGNKHDIALVEQNATEENTKKDFVVFKRRSTVRFATRKTYRNIDFDEQPTYMNLAVSDETPLHPQLPPKRPPRK